MKPDNDRRHVLTGAARKLVIGSVGGAVTAVGVAMLVLPGPGILTIVAGLAILSQEFESARRLRDRVRAAVRARLDTAAETEPASVGEDATGEE